MPAPNDPTLDFYNSERLREWSEKMAKKEENCGGEVNANGNPDAEEAQQS